MARKVIDWEAVAHDFHSGKTTFQEAAERCFSIPCDKSKRFNDSGTGVWFPYAVTEAEMRKQISAHRWPFYVYALCTHTGAAFYFGKGQRDRIFAHATEAEEGGRSEKCRVIRKLGDRLRYAIVMSCSDERYALGLEALHINADYDNLTNINVGSVDSIVRMDEPVSLYDQMLKTLEETRANIRFVKDQADASARLLVRDHPHLLAMLFPSEVCHGS